MKFYKYPRTPHLPFSLGATRDDVFTSMSAFEGKNVVVTRKMDGESFTGYSNGYTHAHSVDSRTHWTRDWAKTYWSRRSYLLKNGFRICAENLYARHSIAYTNLDTYLPLISVWDHGNMCLSWKETCGWALKLNMKTVPVLYSGQWDEDKIRGLHEEGHEGFVVRLAESFHYNDFGGSVAKFVREGHVTTEDHWMHGEIHRNGLNPNADA